MRIKWDLEGLNKLKRGLSDYSAYSNEMEKVAKSIAVELREMIKEETPVGATSKLRNGWIGPYQITKTIGGFRVITPKNITIDYKGKRAGLLLQKDSGDPQACWKGFGQSSHAQLLNRQPFLHQYPRKALEYP